jgi:hypothetical protein
MVLVKLPSGMFNLIIQHIEHSVENPEGFVWATRQISTLTAQEAEKLRKGNHDARHG